MDALTSRFTVIQEWIKFVVRENWARLQQHPRLRFILYALMALLIILFLHAIIFGHRKPVVSPIPVIIAPVITKDVPVLIPALGAVTPIDTVTVRAQLNGELMQVYYKEGQMVKKGELLALIDPRPYEAQLMQNEGLLKRDEALLTNASIDLKRYKVLWTQDSVSQQTLATQEALVKEYEGAV